MFKQLIVSFIFIFSSLEATEITLHVSCNMEPYSYCVDHQPTGVIIETVQSLFEKLNDYTLKLEAIETNSTIEELNLTKDGEIKMISPIEERHIQDKLILEYTDPIFDINGSTMDMLLSEINSTKEENKKRIKLIQTKGKVYHIGFTSIPFPEKKDLIKQINLAIKIMHNSHEIETIFKKQVKDYLTDEGEKVITIGLYNWGEKMVSERNDGYGLIPEIITAAFNEKNIKVHYKFFDYPYTYLLTKWGKICTSGPWLNVGDRKNYMYYSDNLFTTNVYLYYNKKSFEQGITYNEFSDLSKYKVGGVMGTYYEKEYFDENKLMRYTSYATLKDAIKGLLKNEVEVIIAEKNHINQRLSEDFSSNKEAITFHPTPLFVQENYVVFSKRCKSSEALNKEFNSGLYTIKNNGLLEKIFLKYDENIADMEKL